MKKTPRERGMINLINELSFFKISRDQFLILNGAIYCFYIKYFIENPIIQYDKFEGYVMPKNRSIDIDDIIDFQIAENYAKDLLG